MSSPTEEETGHRHIPIRCIVEYVEPSAENGNKNANSRRELDTVVRLPGHCPFDDIVIVALQKLGYTTRDITSAKGALQFPNWNSFSCDSVTDSLEATVESILGAVASLVTLRIRLHGRPKPSDHEEIKEKLLTFLLQRLQTVLNNSGCPINQTLLSEMSNGDLIRGLPNSTQLAFDRWFREQLGQQFSDNGQTNSSLPLNGNYSANCLENGTSSTSTLSHMEETDRARDNSSTSSSFRHWPENDQEFQVKVQCSSPGRRKEDASSKDSHWLCHGADPNPKLPSATPLRSVATEIKTENVENIASFSRMRLLPNRNAVYESNAVLPASPRSTEVVVVTPEMPDGDGEAETIPALPAYQNEPTDLSVRRDEIGGRQCDDGTVFSSGETKVAQSQILRSFRALTGQISAEYSTKDSRSPSPLLPPPPPTVFMPSPAVGGLQNHLMHIQHQQHALQLAAMSRALNFHFGPSVHHLKGMGRPDCERPPFVYKNASLACPQAGLPQLSQDKPSRDQKKRSRVFIDPLTEIPKLERWFSEDTHPSSYVIEKFTDELNRAPYRQRFPKLEPKNLQLWFKNHRAKMKRHRDLAPSQQTVTGRSFDVTTRTPSPGSFYREWTDRSSSTPGIGRMTPGNLSVTMTSSCSPSSSTGSRIVCSPALGTKSSSDCSDDEMEASPEEISPKEMED